jgi:hypothetical protein
MTDQIRLLKHTSPTATRDSGSYEVKFPDGRPSVHFYWDQALAPVSDDGDETLDLLTKTTVAARPSLTSGRSPGSPVPE